MTAPTALGTSEFGGLSCSDGKHNERARSSRASARLSVKLGSAMTSTREATTALPPRPSAAMTSIASPSFRSEVAVGSANLIGAATRFSSS